MKMIKDNWNILAWALAAVVFIVWSIFTDSESQSLWLGILSVFCFFQAKTKLHDKQINALMGVAVATGKYVKAKERRR